MTNLQIVQPGRMLHWPQKEVPGELCRGGEGYVVDLDAPLERDVFCAGQLHKMKPPKVGQRVEATPIDRPQALKLVANATGEAQVVKPETKVEAEIPQPDDTEPDDSSEPQSDPVDAGGQDLAEE